ncbi:hypothetical protein [Roseovarius sp. M141]|uniref:hypothetical protein n=1 Tax=Roseovarius sp. M141 TaxID=2583806 RepID=UPI0020CB99BD|nr:hypothetical protein [Roseovarius sp. M141]MCQ0093432.1 hypothetical protein [Roseovarius sp. M141]
MAVIGAIQDVWWVWDRDDASENIVMEPLKVLTSHLLDTITDFQKRNGIDLQNDLDGQKDIGALYFETPASATEGPDGYAIRCSDDQCDPVEIPPGRIIVVRYTALWLDSLRSVLPMEPLPFEEAGALAQAIHDRMIEAGWERYAYRPDYMARGGVYQSPAAAA